MSPDVDTPPPSQPAPVSYTQRDRRFQSDAYQYLRAGDELPDVDSLPPRDQQLCRVKLFMPSGRFTYYVVAATDYDGQIVVTGYQLSDPPDEDEYGDSSMDELAARRVMGIPIERDLDFKPTPLLEIIERSRPDTAG
jgi:hypothetical protein